MNSVCKGVITENKLQSATIGLLYLMRNGIVVHELVVLPRLQASFFSFLLCRNLFFSKCVGMQVLEQILPLENHLSVLFGVRAKCITETENVVKIILRNISKQQLVNAGIAHVACRL